MTSGYHRNPKATAAITTEDGWMDSGDLAYWANGEIFITGRLKDCIIKSGRNIVPQEVELAAAEVSGVRRGCVAAFGTVDEGTGTERLVVVAETRATRAEELERIEAEVVEKIDSVLGIPPDNVVLVRPQAVPKTSSGKIRRNETRSLYLSGKLNTGKRAPWIQIVRLWGAHFGSWLRLALRRTWTGLRGAYASTLTVSTAAVAGALARLAPGRKTAVRIAQAGARFLLASSGQRVELSGAEHLTKDKPSVFVANRAGLLDPLVLAGTLWSTILVADAAALSQLPGAARFLLRPLVAPTVNGPSADGPPGGTLYERIRKAVESGHSIVVFPDSAVGAPAHRCRFRLDAFRVAASLDCNILPVGLTGTADLFGSDRGAWGNGAKVEVGQPIRKAGAGHHELLELRERVRGALGRLCA